MKKRIHASMIWFSIVIIMIILIFSIAYPVPGTIPCYTVAYVSQVYPIVSRYAEVATYENWNDGKFPLSFAQHGGVGLAISQNALTSLVMSTNPPLDQNQQYLNFRWGLGLDVWDANTDLILLPEPYIPFRSNPTTSPVAVDIGGGAWIIAYTNGWSKICIAAYDDAHHKLTNDISSQLGDLNSEVIGRPSMIAWGDKVTIIWRRSAGDEHPDLVVAQGVISSGQVSFNPAKIIETPETHYQQFTIPKGVTNDPVIAHNGVNYYLAVTRYTYTGATSFITQILASADGTVYSPQKFIDMNQNADTYYGMAGASDHSVLLASIDSFNRTSVVRLSPESNQWESRSDLAEKIFSTPVKCAPFVLTVNTLETENQEEIIIIKDGCCGGPRQRL